MPDIKPIDITFKAPEHIKKHLQADKEELYSISEEYRDVFHPSITKKLGKLFSSAKSKNFERRKKELERKLTDIKNEVTRIFLQYHEDEEIRKAGEACLNTIDDYCKKAGIKIIKITKGYVSYAPTIIRSLTAAKSLLEEIGKTLGSDAEFKKVTDDIKLKSEELVKKVYEAESWGIEEIEEYKKGKKELDAELDKVGEVVNIFFCFGEYNGKLKELIGGFEKGENWEKIKKESNDLLIIVNKLKKDTAEKIQKEEKVSNVAEVIKGAWDQLTKSASIEEINKKIEFAKKLDTYKVFDWNMGAGIEHSLKPLNELKNSSKYGNNILCESQDCLPIARGKAKLKHSISSTMAWGHNQNH